MKRRGANVADLILRLYATSANIWISIRKTTDIKEHVRPDNALLHKDR
jgi:hypothetical protein